MSVTPKTREVTKVAYNFVGGESLVGSSGRDAALFTSQRTSSLAILIYCGD